jgi:hypothetical protein
LEKPKVIIEALPSECRGDDEDKYGNKAVLRNLSEDYCCTACSSKGPTEFLVFKEGDPKTLVCPQCGFEKPCPERPVKT